VEESYDKQELMILIECTEGTYKMEKVFQTSN